MTKPLRHRRCEIENAARVARELGLVVRLESDGAITLIPDTHSEELDRTPIQGSKSLRNGTMRVKLVGVHSVKKRLADGSTRTYYYAWRGGPRIALDPVLDERKFTGEYLRLTRDREDAPYKGCLAEIVRANLKSPLHLKPSTPEGYGFAIRAIGGEFYDLTAQKISAAGSRTLFLE